MRTHSTPALFPPGLDSSGADDSGWLRGRWMWSASDRTPATGHATYAMNRIAALVAAIVRGSIAVAGSLAALVGVSPPASVRWIIPAAAANLLWAALFVWLALARGLLGRVMAVDVAFTAFLCVFQTRLAGSEPLSDGSSWVGATAAICIVMVHLAWHAGLAVAAGIVVVASYAIGAATLPGHGFVQIAVFAIQVGASAALMVLVRRASKAADVALADYDQTRRAESVEQARRAEEREQNRRLHDTVLATLTIVGTGAIARTSVTLRERAEADLRVIEGIAAGPGLTDDVVRLDRLLAEAAYQVRSQLVVELTLAPCEVSVGPATAFVAATGEALANIVRHARVYRAQLQLSVHEGFIVVEVSDAGAGFDPSSVPTHRYGVREAMIGRMRAVGGAAHIESVQSAGTRVKLTWPND